MPPAEQNPLSKIKWNEVTWYSKIAAIVLFVGAVPALSFYIGTQYQTLQESSGAPTISTSEQQIQSTVSPRSTTAFVSVGDKLGGMTVTQVEPFTLEAEQISYNSHLDNFEPIPFGPTNAKLLLQGPIEIRGTYEAIHSPIGFDGYCMSDFDVASLTELPSLPRESTSSVHFCFRDDQAVKQQLGEVTRTVTVQIDNYELNRYPSEVIDWADLVKVVQN